MNNMNLYKGDCLEVMKTIESGSIDAIITDPPYKIIQGGCTNKAVRLKGTTHEDLKNGALFKHNDIKFSDWLNDAFRVLKNGSHCIVMTNDRNLEQLLTDSRKAKFKLLNILVWKKSKHSPNRYYMKNAEFLVLLRKGSAKNINDMGTRQVLEFDNVKTKTHPTEKPVELLTKLIENSTNENEIVLDLFMGTGSTGVAAKNLNRNFIGIEQDDKYFEIAKQRINE
tara:strand:+ start:1368 stop:2042 length:675 start_codon:yes stop_codon:yes gene_type:complete